MTRNWHIPIFFMIFFLSTCNIDRSDTITGSIPISTHFYIDLYNLNSGKKVLSDTLHEQNFDINIGQLPKGIYQMVFSWDRDVMKKQEIERFARQPELGAPKYYMATTFWLDPLEANTYTLLLDSAYNQADLEEMLLGENEIDSPKINIVSDGTNNKIYTEYLKLIERYRLKNQFQKDSLQQMMAYYNELKLDKEADRLNVLLANDWLTKITAELLEEEITFMKKNLNSDVIPHIYQIQANSKENFDHYNEIYKLFPMNIKRELRQNAKNVD